MKKIGIVTIIDNNNYGNRLQNFALCNYINSSYKQFKAETLNNSEITNTKKYYILRKIKRMIFKKKKYVNSNRKKCFEIFNNENIPFSEKKITAFNYLNNEFDYFIVGSDQVWNPFFGRLRDVDLLTGIDNNKRISYAASFGVNAVPYKYNKKMIRELKKFKAISIREEKGIEVLKEISDKNIEIVLDPTLLLSSEQWIKHIKVPKFSIPKKYILLYFLGGINKLWQEQIENFAEKNNCSIINILDKNSIYYESGPSEFLYLEKNAFMIFTDSFHSSVFGFIFDKPFLIFERIDTNEVKINSRLNCFLSKFKLKNRKYNGINITKENLKHDYSEAYKILEEERKKSDSFLRKALDIEE